MPRRTGSRLDRLEAVLSGFTKPQAENNFDASRRTTNLIFGERRLREFYGELFDLRRRSGQQEGFTTDPEYFSAANLVKIKRVAAALIRYEGKLEACVLFVEYCKFGIKLGVFRAGDQAGEGLAIGREEFRMQHVALATQALLRHWRVHGLRLAVKGTLAECESTMGLEAQHRVFFSESLPHKLPLERTYHAMLAKMGARTRRSLATKRRQLESRAGAFFVPSLEPAPALEAMLSLRTRSLPHRDPGFYHARFSLAAKHAEFFSMGVRSPDGRWLSILSGWRQDKVTYVDLQLNDAELRKESLSAVMRAFMLEHEIEAQQEMVNFVDGTSLLLRRYCQPVEPCTCAYLCRPGIRARFFYAVMRRTESEGVSTLLAPYNDGPRNYLENAEIANFGEGRRSASHSSL